MADTIKVFIGYDENETVAFHVLAHSIMRTHLSLSRLFLLSKAT